MYPARRPNRSSRPAAAAVLNSVSVPVSTAGSGPRRSASAAGLAGWKSIGNAASYSAAWKANQPKNSDMCQSAPPACWVIRMASPVLPS